MRLHPTSILPLLIGLVLSVPAALMWVDRDPPVRRISSSVETPAVRAGGELVVRYVIDRQRDCETTVERTLIDGDGEMYVLDSARRTSNGPTGMRSYKRVVPIPAGAAPGAARYRVVTAYVCNPMHRLWPIKATAVDIAFTILPPH